MKNFGNLAIFFLCIFGVCFLAGLFSYRKHNKYWCHFFTKLAVWFVCALGAVGIMAALTAFFPTVVFP